MRRSFVLAPLLALVLAAGCASLFRVGQEFPSPEPLMLVVGTTDKAALRRMFGEPYQVGLDSGDQTWRWLFGPREAGAETTKDLSGRFAADGTVKSYSFTPNF